MTNSNCVNNSPDGNRTNKSIAIYGSSGVLSEIGPLTDGQLIIGSTGNNPVAANLTSAGATILISNGAGTINLEEKDGIIIGSSSFLAYKNSNTTNATGDGTVVTVSAGTVINNVGSNYNNGTYTYTAPSTGKYYLCLSCMTGNAGVSHTFCNQSIVTSNRTYTVAEYNVGAAKQNPNGGCSFAVSVNADMDANDTATGTLTVSGGTKTITFAGSATMATFFGGIRIF